jgi:hypothetical protein
MSEYRLPSKESEQSQKSHKDILYVWKLPTDTPPSPQAAGSTGG